MKKHFLTGLVILLPLIVTFLVLKFVINFLTHPFVHMVTNALKHTHIGKVGLPPILSAEQVIIYTSKLIIIVGIVLFTLMLGFFARWFFMHSLIKFSDRVLHNVPFISKIYKTIQDIINTIFITDKNTFKQVVLAPFPTADVYAIGLLTCRAPKSCNKSMGQDLLSVFIPTTPNPATGFVVLFRREELIFTDLKTEEAIKYVISCGVIVPNPVREDKK
jgi:uncharacterized membrane protein